MANFTSLAEKYFKVVLATLFNRIIREPWFAGLILRCRRQAKHQCHQAGPFTDSHRPKFVPQNIIKKEFGIFRGQLRFDFVTRELVRYFNMHIFAKNTQQGEKVNQISKILNHRFFFFFPHSFWYTSILQITMGGKWYFHVSTISKELTYFRYVRFKLKVKNFKNKNW